MTISVSETFERHPECHGPDIAALFRRALMSLGLILYPKRRSRARFSRFDYCRGQDSASLWLSVSGELSAVVIGVTFVDGGFWGWNFDCSSVVASPGNTIDPDESACDMNPTLSAMDVL
jgi:hypothetical protein